MSLPNILNLVNGASSLTLTLPQMPWDVSDRAVGGGERSAAGIPSNYVIRNDALITLHLRITEGTEWSNYVTFIRAADAAAAAVTAKLDKDVSTTIVGYIESPSVANGDEIKFTRDGNFPSTLLTDLTLRQTTDTVLAPEYF